MLNVFKKSLFVLMGIEVVMMFTMGFCVVAIPKAMAELTLLATAVLLIFFMTGMFYVVIDYVIEEFISKKESA